MKKYIVLIAAVFAGLSAQAQAKKEFTCPVDGNPRSLEQMYSAMQLGHVYGFPYMSEGQIVFVDEQKELSNNKGQLTPIGKTFVDSTTGQIDFRGTFKIGYDYSAKECRRQIVLEKEIGPGVWEGYTAIEICSPEMIDIFSKVKGKSFDEVWKAISPMAQKLQKAYDDGYEKLNSEDGVCYQSWDNKTNKYINGKNYNSAACDQANQELSVLSDKAYRLQGLEISEGSKPYVEYFKDENGIVLPRFKVKLKEFFYRRINSTVYDEETGVEKQVKSCSMNVLHSTGYAGLASQYTWHFLYDNSLTATTWTFDQSNQSVLGKSYDQKIETYKILDLDQYFYQSTGYEDQ